tara:strand:- start:64 stop:234 length:171 start_codon:yes stop_codon:yes gene_type:complete
MIILKKDNHYEHTTDGLKASKMVQDGYEVIKGKGLLTQPKKESKPKKKSSMKSKKK